MGERPIYRCVIYIIYSITRWFKFGIIEIINYGEYVTETTPKSHKYQGGKLSKQTSRGIILVTNYLLYVCSTHNLVH